jgi:hypothetical protein
MSQELPHEVQVCSVQCFSGAAVSGPLVERDLDPQGRYGPVPQLSTIRFRISIPPFVEYEWRRNVPGQSGQSILNRGIQREDLDPLALCRLPQLIQGEVPPAHHPVMLKIESIPKQSPRLRRPHHLPCGEHGLLKSLTKAASMTPVVRCFRVRFHLLLKKRNLEKHPTPILDPGKVSPAFWACSL